MKLPLLNKNRTMQLLNKTAINNVPALYAQDGMGDKTIAHLKFFLQCFTWYVTELNPETGLAFGKIYSSQCPEGELGYIDINELANLSGKIGNAVERDRYFNPTALGDIKN